MGFESSTNRPIGVFNKSLINTYQLNIMLYKFIFPFFGWLQHVKTIYFLQTFHGIAITQGAEGLSVEVEPFRSA